MALDGKATTILLFLFASSNRKSVVFGFTNNINTPIQRTFKPNTRNRSIPTVHYVQLDPQQEISDDSTSPKFQSAPLPPNEKSLDKPPEEKSPPKAAATNTINARLLSEIENQTSLQKAPKTDLGKKAAQVFASSRPEITDEEREAKLAEARDLNGVNPVVAITASLFAFGFAVATWTLTQYLAGQFASHPVESDVYFIQRLASVFRNLVMGLFSLASGFFGVTGMGIFAMGVRVAYGVAKGELDPTPVSKKSGGGEEIKLPNAWDLMMGKKPGRRGRR
mmetsp:Transcript_58810/g.70138  ORF Transcript_58810/g.70138 Transcript_58810/m.70138 type:complete len:279 (+) Transcript_58810:34-870(+)|eukprot:CAMPEP_0172495158 /NCGR_PEP_ID=MMETSP1066-20121228/64183_1 /TAXON_ID=671091 /ORGANISM="Coscinodiscus wailesii, Strain CCMP2513" /LENGTH=278 /DNA_ID=CAMNT_0013266647 /DNA_START=16 /DNA_END=852 /DNA_ORIENTATION=-